MSAARQRPGTRLQAVALSLNEPDRPLHDVKGCKRAEAGVRKGFGISAQGC